MRTFNIFSVKEILNIEIQKYINANLKTDLHSLLLKKSPFPEVSMQEIVQQIKGKNVAAKKFPFLMKEGILFPPNLNLEQTSSEATATYKSKLVSGKTFLDLTCGFGIDAYFLSQNSDQITLVEQNSQLIDLVGNNWKILNRKATFVNQNLEDFLNKNSEKFDVIFLDPARRDSNKNKVFLLEDLSPNLLDIQDEILKISKQILIKLSPLIDISYLISVLKNISEIHIVAVKNEVKEILVLINSDKKTENIKINCANLETSEPDFEFYFNENFHSVSEYSESLKFLYIPNNSVLKSGAFNLVSEKFNVKKLHPNTHFYTSEKEIPQFPGRVLSVESVDAKTIKKGEKYNIISKNYPLKPEEIRKKYHLKDGGEHYLIFTTSVKGKVILKSK